MTRGKFITFEGGEGAGKSTQARLLANRLEALGRAVLVTREPGGSPFAERIRELIFSDFPHSHDTEFLLFAAARAEHVSATIQPALSVGTWVVCDRFIDSTRVYQGDVWQVDRALIAQIEKHTVAPHYPDLTLILDLPAEVGVERAKRRGDMNRWDEAAMNVHNTLRRGFLAIATAEPQRCVVIDGSRGVEAVSADIWAAVTSRLLVKA